jgi:DNA-directed RNA polymerase subunit H (RpoH/RPB5)
MENLMQEVCGMTTTKAMRKFPKEALDAMRSEISSLLGKFTFDGVMIHELSQDQRKKILRTIMNITEKWLPDLDENGKRLLDKIKARFCVDGRGQIRTDYEKDEIESPTAYFISICSVAQMAANQKRFVCVGDVGTAYLNALMPSHDPKKHVHVMIDKDVADIMCELDPVFKQYQAKSGKIVARLRKALYGCIESAKLWHLEITKTLNDWGFIANPRDPCILNKDIRGEQLTVVVYVDDLMMTCVYKNAVQKLAEDLRVKYGQFRTSDGPIVNFLGTKWDYSEEGYVKLLQLGMIQDLIKSRENTLEVRGAALKSNIHTPGASYLFERSEKCPLLNDKDRATYHTDVATALYIGQRSRPDINTVIGELCKRVKSPTTEDDSKLDRLIAYLKTTRDIPLRLGYTCELPRVIVSIDAAFANREMMKSTSGVCITLGTGFFMASSKVQKINSKSSTEAEIIAVSDGMNVPMWLADFIKHQGFDKQTIQVHQDNQSCIALLTKGRSTAENTRFIAIRHYWISYYIFTKVVELVYVPTEEMVSDYFTKPLQGTLFEKLVTRILGKK